MRRQFPRASPNWTRELGPIDATRRERLLASARTTTQSREIELTHRVTSGLALLALLALVVAVWRSRPAGHPARRAAAWSMLFMLTEAGVGAGLVLFELVADNQSMARALFMATHLVNTFFLLAFLTLTAHFASGGAPFRWSADRQRTDPYSGDHRLHRGR